MEVNAKGQAVETGEAQVLFGPVIAGAGFNYDVSADGQRFLVVTRPGQEAGEQLTVVQNWAAGLKK